ncbi:MAG TPA: 2-hydroxychromene-2-carboxylate isomerase [Burkholderiales bacterium]|nr:2-hydroxychromene-2-carboxylate isomerase [Burkholderiales bacterium]
MSKTVDYYFSPMSPWTYLGHERFAQMAKKYGATVGVKPVDYGRIFPLSGGLPLAKRAPQRQKYRLVELERWRKHLGLPLTLQPKFFPYDTGLATLLIIAARRQGEQAAMRLAGAILRRCWAEEQNMADETALAAAARGAGLDARALFAAANKADIRADYEAFTDEAIARDVFGAPTYVYDGELFWGQDRLDFLERALAR